MTEILKFWIRVLYTVEAFVWAFFKNVLDLTKQIINRKKP
jgi:hypothetical protein